MFEKLAIGTAQFGLNYGINNEKGELSQEGINSILDYATEKSIDTLDTAYLYGNSEEKIGKYKNREKFKIISKFPYIKDINKYINESLNRLKIKQLHAYLSHSFSDIKENIAYIESLYELKEKGLTKKVGFSIYYPEELEFLLDNKVKFDIIQIPYNIMDRRFEKYFPLSIEKGFEIHVRSVFLQGLFFKDIENLPSFFSKVKDKIIELQNLGKQFEINLNEILLTFVLSNKFVSRVIIGVDSLAQLRRNVEFDFNKCINVLHKIDVDYFLENDENILLPFKWRL